MGVIQELAQDLGADERRLRRAAAEGVIRGRRVRPRTLRLEPGERDYLHGHWDLIAALREELRSQRHVRLVVLYGSVARGDEDAGSDVDVLVSLDRSAGAQALPRLAALFSEITDRPADVALLKRVEARAPLLLERALDEGRVILDRDQRWPALQARKRAIRARARRAYEREMREADAAIEELVK